MQAKPRKGEGDRFLKCPHYKDCLDLAALRNWKAFTCESCPVYIHRSGESPVATPEKKETARLCRECGKNPTIQPTSPLCASCIGRHTWKERDKKRRRKRRPKKKKKTPNKAGPEKPPQSPNTALTIEFKKHSSVLREVEKLAEEEVRPVELQVIYILKQYLKNVNP